MKYTRSVSYAVFVLLALSLIYTPVFSIQKDSRTSTASDKKTQYVQGELIIKLKGTKAEKAALGIQDGKDLTAADISGLDSFNNLNRKHQAKKIEPLFKSLRKKGRKGLKNKLEKRNKRISQNAIIPKLENIYKLKLDKNVDIQEAIKEYLKDPNIEYAEPNYKVEIQIVPNDPYYSSNGSWGQGYEDLWGLKNINAEQAWDLSQGEGVVVAVVDTGIDYNHEDIAENVWINAGEIPGDGIDNDENGFIDDVSGWDFAYGDNDPKDGNGHGTHVAGTIAAVGNNSIGVIGVAPKAKVMAVKGLDDSGSGYASDLADAIMYAADMGADVLNNSWGGEGNSQTITDAVNYAFSKGCVVVAAAGNSNMDASRFIPANIEGVIAVAASDQNNNKCSFSNYGNKIDLSAPGGNNNILSLLASNSLLSSNSLYKNYFVGLNYIRLQGTSMAAPHVSGLAALILDKYPDITNKEVRARMMLTTDPFPVDYPQGLGTGVINAYNALTCEPKTLLRVKAITVSEITGDGDNLLEAGETIQLVLDIENIGEDVSSVSGVLTTNNDNISILTHDSNFGDILQAKTNNNSSNPFVFTVTGGASYGEIPVECKVTLSDAAGYTLSLDIKIVLSSIKIVREGTVWDLLISDNKIIWTDNCDYNTNAHLYDIETGQERKIITGQFLSLSMSGNKIIWADSRNGNGDIYLYDLETNQERQITADTYNQLHPVISGNKIVWADDRNGNSDIYLYDLGTNQERQITTNNAYQSRPVISGNKIVWEDSRNGIYNSDIYLYDLETNQEKQITANDAYQGKPVISGNKIVWEDYRNGDSDIYLYDLETNQERQITTDNAYQNRPVISGNKIVWEDYRNGADNSDIYLYDLETNQESQITAGAYHQSEPAISGNKIVWVDRRNGIFHTFIGMAEFPDITPPSIPVVTDEGALTTNVAKLTASWKSYDLESGIDEYQYRITRDLPGEGVIVRDWTSTGTENYITAVGLTLTNGKTYYLSVKAKNKAGLWSDAGYSDGIIINNPLSFISILSDKTIIEGQKVIFYVRAQDLDKNVLTYSAQLVNGDSLVNIGAKFCAVGLGDVDNSGYVNFADLALLKKAFSSGIGSANYNPYCDFDNNGFVDSVDLETLKANFLTAREKVGLFEWTPNELQAGDYPILFTVFNNNFSVSKEIVIHVSDSIIRDTTKPITPVVTDEGAYTANKTQLTANWSSSDPESAIAEYQYSIGTNKGATDVVNWISTGTNASATATGLSLVSGTTCYFNVRAMNGVGLWSDISYSDGIIVNNAPYFLPILRDQTVNKDKKLVFYVTPRDDDKDKLTYSALLDNGASLVTIGAGFYTRGLGDVNNDGYVNFPDLYLLKAAFNSSRDSINYNPYCDFDNNGFIDSTDLDVIKANFYSVGEKTGLFEWTPSSSHVGNTCNVVFSVTDNKLPAINTSVGITVSQ